MKMDVTELKARKIEMEHEILETIRRFESDTGLYVTGVRSICAEDMDGSRGTIHVESTVEM